MISRFFLVSVICIAVSEIVFADASPALSAIEDQTPWKIANGTMETFNGKTLPGYRPHDSAIVNEYGITKLTKAQLRGVGQASLTIEIYEMLDSAAAYGLFTYLRPAAAEPLAGIGTAAAVTLNEVTLHQSKYYLALRSEKSDSTLSTSMLPILQAASKALPTDFSLPLVASKLPTEYRVRQSEKFVMGAEGLSQILPLGGKDPFGLSTGAEAALAKYADANGGSATLLLIYYPTQQLARRFLETGYQQYSARYPKQPAFYKRDGPMVVLVLASSSPEFAATLLEQVSYVSIVSWDPKAEPPSIGLVMMRIFIFCGIMLGITFLCGLVFGGARIIIKRFFPGKVFDRPETMEVIRLHLDEKQ